MFEVLKKFNLFDKTENVVKFGRGALNCSYLVYAKDNCYLLQMFEENVFKKPDKVIANIKTIKKYLLDNGDTVFFLNNNLLDNENNNVVHINGTYWRGFKMPKNANMYKKVINSQMIYEIGKAIGNFHKTFKDFPVQQLNSSIPDYHNTTNELEFLTKTIYESKSEKSFLFFNDAKFVLDRKEDFQLINLLLENKEVPLRAIHNNLRLNNFVFDDDTYNVIAIIGYDAVMPGSLLYDIGEALRQLTATTQEDESNLSLVRININFYKEFLKGYFEETIGFITKKEVDCIVDATRIMTLENGLRYLNDYLAGNKIYKVGYKEQNIDKARNQFRLVEDIETYYEGMRQVVAFLYNQVKNRKCTNPE